MRLPSFTCSSSLWLLSMLVFIISLQLSFNPSSTMMEWELSSVVNTPLIFYIILDPQGLTLSATVLFISANILQFASFYMQDEKFLARFTHLVMLFVLSMNMLIYIPHLLFLLLGWDGLGLTSFLLVIYYYSPKSLGAGMITALTNRIGDVLILVSIGWMLTSGQWNIMNMWPNSMSPWIIMFLCLAAMTKSAQIPFSSWLPAAMAAPTPVSALVHSSTLVTAGVFLLIRFYPFLSNLKFFHLFLMISATLTMFMAGLAAMVECDLKKIIALSTLSQLGVMMMAIALGLPHLALFHLITHALFKALLFVCAGTLIHVNNHTQDLRQVGEILSQLPLTASCFFVSNIALCAMPFMAGFYSKDLILELMMSSTTNSMILMISGAATALTAAYSIRFMLMAWVSMYSHQPLHSIKNDDSNIMTPSFILSLGAIMGGSLLNWMMITPIAEPFLATPQKLSPFMVTFLGFLLPMIFITLLPQVMMKPKLTHYALALMWFITPLASQFTLKAPMTTSLIISKNMDQGWNEYMGGQGVLNLTTKTSVNLLTPQSNMPTKHLTALFLLFAPFMTIV